MVPDVRRLLTVAVYAVAILLGGSVLVPDPTHPLLVVPVLGGGVVLAHAASTDHLDHLGYAIGGMWAAVLLLSIATGVAETVGGIDRPPLTRVPATSAVGTVGVTAVLVAGYLFLLRRRSDGVPASE